MQFIVRAEDFPDAGPRRAAARPLHLESCDTMVADGSLLYAAALLNDSEQMMGSLMVVDFCTRHNLDAWLATEPYVTQKVWDKIEITPCRPGPMFTKCR